MEVVDELDLVDVLKDEITHGTSLRLREGEWSGEGLGARVLFRSLVAMGEAIVTVQVDAGVCVITTEPLATPRVVKVLALHDVIGSLEEGLLDIEDTVSVEHGHEVEGCVLKQVDVVLVIMDDSMKELEDDVEGHLDRYGLAGVMGASNEHSGALFSRLRASLELDERDITALICLTEASDSDVIGELVGELVNDNERVMVAVVVAEARDEELVFHSVAKLVAALHLLSE